MKGGLLRLKLSLLSSLRCFNAKRGSLWFPKFALCLTNKFRPEYCTINICVFSIFFPLFSYSSKCYIYEINFFWILDENIFAIFWDLINKVIYRRDRKLYKCLTEIISNIHWDKIKIKFTEMLVFLVNDCSLRCCFF